MIITFTDFGTCGPYQAQMCAAIRRYSDCAVLSLIADAPVHNPRAAGCLLAAYMSDFAEKSVFLCVVDPDVGSGDMTPVIIDVADRWFVGPNNGLFDRLLLHYPAYEISEISWRPQALSASFHGRDLYAPVAAMLAEGSLPEQQRLDYKPPATTQADMAETIYIDHFGNVMTGLRARNYPTLRAISVNGVEHALHRTYTDVAVGKSFCYANANGLIEIAMNKGRAADQHAIAIGQPVEIIV